VKLKLVEVQKTIYSWIKNELSGSIPPEQIIWRQQSEPLPPRPCVTMKITGGPSRVGFNDNAVYDTAGRFKIGGQRTMVVSIQIFGDSRLNPKAYQVAIDLNASLEKMTVLDRLRSGGVAAQLKGDVTNLTALEETEYEERAQFDVTLGVAENITDEPGIIEQANITENLSGP